MTGRKRGGGRCKRRRDAMVGSRGTAETKKIDCNYDSPNFNSQITEKPSGFAKLTELPPNTVVELDFYTQARKSLSFRSPFDSEGSPAPPASISGGNFLPSGVSHLLRRHSDGRKRQKKSISSPNTETSAPAKQKGNSIWAQAEEYFRELCVEDVERLERFSGFAFSGKEKCLLIPSFGKDDDSSTRYDAFNRKLKSSCEKYILSLGKGAGASSTEKGEDTEVLLVQEENGPTSMDVDGDEGAKYDFEIKEENGGEKREDSEKGLTCFSGVEWLLGSRSKIYLISERPTTKRKLSERDGGLEKLLVACPVEGLDYVCHYCGYGDMGDPLNNLIKCVSCAMVIHQRCYGALDDNNNSWSCSWCKWKIDSGLNSERPCLLCPKPGGALKPVQKRALASGSEHGSDVGFAHLFCCLWIPEIFVENIRTMEPVMNLDELKDTRRKLICYLCKVKWGACVRCSNGACRTSFHPLCAREARHRMEIWGKLGCDEVELRAFCSKHSRIQYRRGARNAVNISLPGDSVSSDLCPSKLNDDMLDGESLINRSNPESHPAGSDLLQSTDERMVNTDGNENVPINGHENADASSCLNFTVLKKLIDLGKVEANDVASEIGVAPDSLNTILTDNHMVPELQHKLLKWLKKHAHIGSIQKVLNLDIKSFAAPKSGPHLAEGCSAVSVEDSGPCDDIPVKSVPPCRRIKSNSCSSNDKTCDETDVGDIRLCGGEDSNGVCKESLPVITEKVLNDTTEQQNNNSMGDSIEGNKLIRERKQFEQMTTQSPVLANGEVMPYSYIHPFVYSRLTQRKSSVHGNAEFHHSAGVREGSHLEASTSSGICCSNHNHQATSGDSMSGYEEVNLDQLVRARDLGMLKLSPIDEVEGELIYYQHRILCNAVTRKHISDDLIAKVSRNLPQEIQAAGTQKWDDVLVSRYNHELREAKKKGRKERRHEQAQAVLAAATAAAAASSRLSTIRKDMLEESANHEDLIKMNVSNATPGVYSQLNPRVRNTISRSTVARLSPDGNSDLFLTPTNVPKESHRICEICTRPETILNPVLVCSSCKIAVHLDCYRSVKSTTGLWYCELCEDLFTSQSSVALATNSWEKPCFVAECGLCGGTASAFRKSVDGQWIHALCAEWVLESTYKRGQVNLVEGLETAVKGIDSCAVCHRKHGVCLKCSYGHCQNTFHPTCARSAGLYMIVRISGGKLQHKAYCEKHGLEQKAKSNTQKHGIEEFKNLKKVRVELERLRLLCERIVKREKLKRELVLCSHDIRASNRDSVLSALARHPFYQPEISSESATTSIRGYTDGYKSGSEKVQRSDDITVDSTVAGKRNVKRPMSMNNDQKIVDSSTPQNLYTLKPVERASFSGKQIQRPSASQNLLEDAETHSRYRKSTETFEKELLMTSDQASMKNQRLPKGFVYVPIRSLSKDKNG